VIADFGVDFVSTPVAAPIAPGRVRSVRPSTEFFSLSFETESITDSTLSVSVDSFIFTLSFSKSRPTGS
jgi:hypothetical protein